MQFAHFAHVWGKKHMTAQQRYDQLWRELKLCDELGFDQSFCVEHHFRHDESWMSAPMLYAVAAGMQTKRLRPGSMGCIVPLHQPVRLIEEIAIADQMLGGPPRGRPRRRHSAALLRPLRRRLSQSPRKAEGIRALSEGCLS